jgi:hypothetical protein
MSSKDCMLSLRLASLFPSVVVVVGFDITAFMEFWRRGWGKKRKER